VQLFGERKVPTVRMLGDVGITKDRGEAIREHLWHIANALTGSPQPADFGDRYQATHVEVIPVPEFDVRRKK